MKHSGKSVERKTHALPNIKCEQQQLTSFAGLVLLQPFLAAIDFTASVTRCFRHVRAGKIYGRATVFLQLIIHLLLGYRDLRESAYYRDDPMVKRVLGLQRLPDVATLSRMLKDADQKSIERLRRLLRRLVVDRLRELALPRVTLDFDGSVQSRRAEPKARPWGSTRRRKAPAATTRFSVRSPRRCRSWRTFDAARSFFERLWKPKSWEQAYRFVFVRKRAKKQQKGPVQLDLLVPYEYGDEFKVIITNKRVGVGTVLRFHEGRAAQEGIFGELKTHCAMGHVPVRRRLGNQMYLLAGLFGHNLVRELQMRTEKQSRGTTNNRAGLWIFETVDTVRKTLLQRAGRLTRPSGKLTLTISGGATVKEKLLSMLDRLRPAA